MNKASQKGYIAIVTVIILSAVTLGIASTVSLLAIGEAERALAVSKGEGSLQLAEGCAEDGLLRVQQSSSYNGGTITRPEGTCVITVSNNGGNWSLSATSTQSNYNRTIQVSFSRLVGSSIAISSWQDSLPVPTPTLGPSPTPTSLPTATPTLIPTPTPTPTPTPPPLALSSLVVSDSTNASNWSLQTNIQVGNTLYGDKTYAVSSLASSLSGSAWIRPAMASKAYTSDPLVTFSINRTATVYIGFDTRSTLASWVDSTWTNTGLQMVDNESSPVTFTFYKKMFPAGTVSLGHNAVQTSGVDVYIVTVQ